MDHFRYPTVTLNIHRFQEPKSQIIKYIQNHFVYMETEESKKAEKLTLMLKKISPVLAILYIIIAAFLMYLHLNPWLAVIVSMVIISVPVFYIGGKIDRLLGIKKFRGTGIPRVEVIKMLLVGIINLLIFISIFYTGNTALKLSLMIAGLIFFITITMRQGKKLSKLNSKIYKNGMNSEKRKAYTKIEKILINKNNKRKNNK